jgi:aconitate hydratase
MNDVFVIEDVYAQVDKGEIIVKVVNKNMKFTTILELSNYDKRVLKEGGAVNYLKNKLK